MRQLPAIPRPGRRGFTLIESAMVAVIVAFGVMGTLQLIAAGTMSNIDATKLTTAAHLAGNVREMMLAVRFKEAPAVHTWGPEPGETAPADLDDVDDFDGQTFSPPLDVRREALTSHTNWSQSIEVHSVDEAQVTTNQGKDNLNRPISRVVVRVSHHAELIHESSWLVTDTAPPN